MEGSKDLLKDSIVLIVILVMGVVFNNRLVAAGAALLIVVQATGIKSLLTALDKRSLDAGLTLLIIAVLIPFANGKAKPSDIAKAFTSLPGVLAIAAGAVQAYISGQGIELLKARPDVIIGLLVGTILGVCFFGGIPVGPLAAAGLAALALRLWR